MELRQASMNDFEKVFELKLKLKESERQFNKNAPPVKEVQEHYKRYLEKDLSSENSTVFIALEGEKIIAMVIAKTYHALPTKKSEKRGYLSNLFVEEEFRRKGVSKALMQKAIEWLKEKGA